MRGLPCPKGPSKSITVRWEDLKSKTKPQGELILQKGKTTTAGAGWYE